MIKAMKIINLSNVKCGKVVIYTSAYESWGFLVVDPETWVSSASSVFPISSIVQSTTQPVTITVKKKSPLWI
jgi:hypothetical protein